MFKSTRLFKLWDYSVSHQQLLIRSPMTPDISTNIDLLFWGVKYLTTETILRGVEIVRADDSGNLPEPAIELLKDGYKVFRIQSGESSMIIVSSGFRVVENQLDIFESTITTANDEEDRDVGTELARA